METGARSEETHRVFKCFEEVLGEEWDIDIVLFAAESCEDGIYVGSFIRHQAGPRWLKAHLIAVLLRHAPLILDRNARFVLHLELLLRRDTHVARREEYLLILHSDLWTIAIALQKHLLHVLR